MSAYKLIDAEKAYSPISLLCRILKVSRSGCYDWKDGSPFKRDYRGREGWSTKRRKKAFSPARSVLRLHRPGRWAVANRSEPILGPRA